MIESNELRLGNLAIEKHSKEVIKVVWQSVTIEILISKYKNAKRQQEELQKETPLSNVVQHQLLDQNIHIFNGIIEDLRRLI